MSHRKPKKTRTYNFRVDEDDWNKIRFIIDEAKLNLPSVLRSYIGKVYDSTIKKDKDIDDGFYGL